MAGTPYTYRNPTFYNGKAEDYNANLKENLAETENLTSDTAATLAVTEVSYDIANVRTSANLTPKNNEKWYDDVLKATSETLYERDEIVTNCATIGELGAAFAAMKPNVINKFVITADMTFNSTTPFEIKEFHKVYLYFNDGCTITVTASQTMVNCQFGSSVFIEVEDVTPAAPAAEMIYLNNGSIAFKAFHCNKFGFNLWMRVAGDKITDLFKSSGIGQGRIIHNLGSCEVGFHGNIADSADLANLNPWLFYNEGIVSIYQVNKDSKNAFIVTLAAAIYAGSAYGFGGSYIYGTGYAGGIAGDRKYHNVLI